MKINVELQGSFLTLETAVWPRQRTKTTLVKHLILSRSPVDPAAPRCFLLSSDGDAGVCCEQEEPPVGLKCNGDKTEWGKEQICVCVVSPSSRFSICLLLRLLLPVSLSPPCDSPPTLPLCFLIALLSSLHFVRSQLPPPNQNRIRWDAAQCPAHRWLFILLSFSLFKLDFPWLVVWDWVGSTDRVFHWSTQVQAPLYRRTLLKGPSARQWIPTLTCGRFGFAEGEVCSFYGHVSERRQNSSSTFGYRENNKFS